MPIQQKFKFKYPNFDDFCKQELIPILANDKLTNKTKFNQMYISMLEHYSSQFLANLLKCSVPSIEAGRMCSNNGLLPFEQSYVARRGLNVFILRDFPFHIPNSYLKPLANIGRDQNGPDLKVTTMYSAPKRLFETQEQLVQVKEKLIGEIREMVIHITRAPMKDRPTLGIKLFDYIIENRNYIKTEPELQKAIVDKAIEIDACGTRSPDINTPTAEPFMVQSAELTKKLQYFLQLHNRDLELERIYPFKEPL